MLSNLPIGTNESSGKGCCEFLMATSYSILLEYVIILAKTSQKFQLKPKQKILVTPIFATVCYYYYLVIISYSKKQHTGRKAEVTL